MVGTLRKCHTGTLANLMRPFTDLALPGTPPSAREAEQAAQSLHLRGFQAPSWANLLDGTDGANPAREEDSSLKSRRGWQRSASAAVDKRAFEMLFADLEGAQPEGPRHGRPENRGRRERPPTAERGANRDGHAAGQPRPAKWTSARGGSCANGTGPATSQSTQVPHLP